MAASAPTRPRSPHPSRGRAVHQRRGRGQHVLLFNGAANAVHKHVGGLREKVVALEQCPQHAGQPSLDVELEDHGHHGRVGIRRVGGPKNEPC